MSKLLTVASGRRAKWIVAAVWLVAMFAVIGANLPGKFTDAENNESTTYLPGDAESTKALQAVEELRAARPRSRSRSTGARVG